MTLMGTITEKGRTYRIHDDSPSGHCSQLKRHDLCAHRPGGPQEHGVYNPAGDGLPAFVWRCGCPCHAGQQVGPQLALFGRQVKA